MYTLDKRLTTLLAFILLLAFAGPVLAHHPMGGQTPETALQGLLSGFGHPIIGLDHLAFIIVAGFLAYGANRKLRFVLPLVFILATLAGTGIHLAALNIPFAESFVAGTVLLAGVLLILPGFAKTRLTTLLFAVAGIFHGYAYGESIIGAEQTPLFAYLVGFAVIQYTLMALGLMAMARLQNRNAAMRHMTVRISGGAAVAIGCLFLFGSLA
ncbi:MAG: HupE/UreJ family protein [Candidatus Competibacteraceae bacterium]